MINDFDKFLNDNKEEREFTLFGKVWKINYSYKYFLEFTNILQNDKSILANNDVEKLYTVIFKVALPDDFFDELKVKKDKVPFSVIKGIIDLIFKCWTGLTLDDYQKNLEKKK